MTTPKAWFGDQFNNVLVGTNGFGDTWVDFVRLGTLNGMFKAGVAGTLPAGASVDDPAGYTALLPNWTVFNAGGPGTATLVVDSSYPGGQYVQLSPGVVGTANRVGIASDPIHIQGGGLYATTATVATNVAGTDLTISGNILYYDQSGAFLSSTGYFDFLGGPTRSLALCALPGIASPLNARTARVVISVYSLAGITAANWGRIGAVSYVPMLSPAAFTGLSKNGTISDVDYPGAGGTVVPAGTLAVDTADTRIYFKTAAWHYVNATAGFEVPATETQCPVCLNPLLEGDDVVGTLNDTYSDGALHGVWIHFKCGRNNNHPKVGHPKPDALNPSHK